MSDHFCDDGFSFPREIKNRPGLARVDYRIGHYGHFREFMLRALNQDPVLASWTHRAPDDPGVALLEGAAILGDILCFYQDLYANEAFLRTARWRESIADLVKLTDYQLSPGLGGSAHFAFNVRGAQPVTVPAGFPLKAQLQNHPQPVEFETTHAFKAWPDFGTFHFYRPSVIPDFSANTTTFTAITETVVSLKLTKKDRLLLLDRVDEATEKIYVVMIKDISQYFDRTRITIEGSWEQSADFQEIKAFKIGRTFRHFGHNAPREVVISRRPESRQYPLWESGNSKVNKAFKQIGEDAEQGPVQIVEAIYQAQILTQSFQIFIIYNRSLNAITKSGPTDDTIIDPAIGALEIPLNNEVPDLAVGGKLVIHGLGNQGYGVVRTIKALRSGSMTWGALSGATTVVTLDQTMGTGKTDIRNLAVHETLGDSFTLQADREPVAASQPVDTLHFFGDERHYLGLNGRMVIFHKEDGTTARATVQTQEINPAGGERLRPVSLDPPLPNTFTYQDFPLEEPGVVVFGNIISATQGKTQKDTILGNGDGRKTFQTFQLPKAPLTWRNVPGATPPQVPELGIFVENIRWKRVPSFFGTGPDDKVYIVRQDAEDRSHVQFGDGKTGKRLPSGVKNVMARYRVGTGAYGPKVEGTKVQPTGKLKELRQVQLPGVVSGGALPEDGAAAAKAAPGRVRSLNRLVALEDFETEAAAIPGVSLASAAWDLVEHSPAVVVAVLMETGREQEFETVQRILQDMNRTRGAQRWPVEVVEGKRAYVSLSLKVALKPGHLQEPVLWEVKEALGATGDPSLRQDQGLFSQARRQFGQDAHATKVEGVVQNVEGVSWVKVTRFFNMGPSEEPETLRTSWFEYGSRLELISCGRDRLLTLHQDHLQITAVSETPAEVG